MCSETQIVKIEENCKGTCEETGEKKGNCHTEELSIDELKAKVKSLRMKAMEMATQLHDLAEERLPEGWEEIPEIAEKAYKAHKDYFKWKAKLDALKKANK